MSRRILPGFKTSLGVTLTYLTLLMANASIDLVTPPMRKRSPGRIRTRGRSRA